MSNEMMKQELSEAIAAGERAIRSLASARDKLNSAGNWGLWDMFGGGAISGIVKHSKVNEASNYVEDAKRDLAIFQRELRDVHVPSDLRVEINGFLSFMDFFCDGFLADWMVQSQISKAKKQIEEVGEHVESILDELRKQYRQLG